MIQIVRTWVRSRAVGATCFPANMHRNATDITSAVASATGATLGTVWAILMMFVATGLTLHFTLQVPGSTIRSHRSHGITRPNWFTASWAARFVPRNWAWADRAELNSSWFFYILLYIVVSCLWGLCYLSLAASSRSKEDQAMYVFPCWLSFNGGTFSPVAVCGRNRRVERLVSALQRRSSASGIWKTWLGQDVMPKSLLELDSCTYGGFHSHGGTPKSSS